MLVRIYSQMSSIIYVETTSRSGYRKEQWVVTYKVLSYFNFDDTASNHSAIILTFWNF